MIKVILADHQIVYRVGMASALAAEDDIRIVGQPRSIEQLIHGLESFRPNLLILSSAFLVRIDDIRKICGRQLTAIILLEDPGDAIVQQFSSDVHGVIRRSADPETVVRCIRHVVRGGTVLRMGHGYTGDAWEDPVGLRVQQRLTPHELKVIALVVQGYRNREIATRMNSTEPGVKNSLRRIFDKTGVCDRLELALFVMHHQVLKFAMADVHPMTAAGSMGTSHSEWRHTSGPTAVN
ncbi:MAG: response regulator transcription factor [Candidatus Korobacteraceae bacterium]